MDDKKTEEQTTSLTRYKSLAKKIRVHVLRMTHYGKSSHIGTGLSIADLLAVLYGGVLRINSQTVNSPERDRFIQSKGHGCAALYAALAESGFFPLAWLDDFYLDGARLAGHVTHIGVPGVEVSTGSLGHGLSIASGMALAGKRAEQSYRVFTLMSDGECDEGSIWEAVLFASHHRLENLVAIVDYNKIQSLGNVKDILALEPFADKWRAFGWAVKEINGHDYAEIENALCTIPFEAEKPSCIIAHTVKGKGVSFMEGQLLWHYRSPDEKEFQCAMAELEKTS